MTKTLSQRKPILVFVLIAVNLFIFGLWQSRGWEDTMRSHFLLSFSQVIEGQWWTLVTSFFSHNLFLHFFINMYVLFSFGSVLELVLGRKRFLAFYMTAGLMGSFFHIFLSAFLLGSPQLQGLGASGAIAGLVLLFAFLFPREKILIFGLIPVPAIAGGLALIGLDLWGLYAQAHGGGLPIGHGAHLGGALTGFFTYLSFMRGRRRD